jgi:uncharacterized membrane-anchored protein
MYLFSYYFTWVIVAIIILTLIMSIFTYRQQKEYHNGKSLFAIGILAVLTLIAVWLAIAQTRGILPARSSNSTLFSSIYLLMAAVWQLAFFYKSLRGRGWRIFRVCFAGFAVVLAIFVVVGYIYNW